MAEVLHFPSSPRTSSSSSSTSSCAPPFLNSTEGRRHSTVTGRETAEDDGDRRRRDQLSFLALLVTLFRKSLIVCKGDSRELCAMEIGWPTNVRHVAHVTFDPFNGFLGLPVEFEPEVPRRAPSASANVFGVSTESMQLSYDSRGNSVPTVLLLMQNHLYAQCGLQAEGIFRINADNTQEEYVRDQLNSGVVPVGIDVHCLAGLIKAWFRELPTGVLDPLSPEQVMKCQTEEECAELVRCLPPTEAVLLDWAINLMADVVQQEHLNKMNARNIAMVFAPNMTQNADPLTALMYAVQVMNFLKTLIIKTLREREDSVLEPAPASRLEPSDENGHQSPSQTCLEEDAAAWVNEETEQAFVAEEPLSGSSPDCNQDNNTTYGDCCYIASDEPNFCLLDGSNAGVQANARKNRIGQSSSSNPRKGSRRTNRLQQPDSVEKSRGGSNLSRVDSTTERVEAWR